MCGLRTHRRPWNWMRKTILEGTLLAYESYAIVDEGTISIYHRAGFANSPVT